MPIRYGLSAPLAELPEVCQREVPEPRAAVAQGWGESSPPIRAHDHAVAGRRVGHPRVILVVRFPECNVPGGCARFLKLISNGPSPAELPEPRQALQVVRAAPHTPPAVPEGENQRPVHDGVSWQWSAWPWRSWSIRQHCTDLGRRRWRRGRRVEASGPWPRG